ncbi:uncharacterized protein ACOB8E_000741 isoform 1-T1 [Sarcophilus harrisii]
MLISTLVPEQTFFGETADFLRLFTLLPIVSDSSRPSEVSWKVTHYQKSILCIYTKFSIISSLSQTKIKREAIKAQIRLRDLKRELLPFKGKKKGSERSKKMKMKKRIRRTWRK